MKEKTSEKVKAHIQYKLADGTKIPGSTTVLGLRAKPQLVPWANKLGLQGIEVGKYVDNKAIIGTIAHYLILCHLSKVTPELNDYSKNDIDKAENSFLSYLHWEKEHDLKVILTERPFVSEIHKYGGTVDLVAEVNGELNLIDFKTGSGIYKEMFYQLASYSQLLKENGFDIKNQRILRIGRDETETFEEKVKQDLTVEIKIFMDLLDVYYQEKLLGGK